MTVQGLQGLPGTQTIIWIPFPLKVFPEGTPLIAIHFKKIVDFTV